VKLAFGPRQFVLALDASSVSGGVARGQTLESVTVVPLSPGALLVSALEPNVLRREEVTEAVKAVGRSLGFAAHGVRVLLPSGVARIMLLKGGASGVDVRDLARFRLARSLPYPEGEALVDVVRVSREGHLGVAIRRGIVESYEAVLVGAGIRKESLDLTPVAALVGLEALSPKVGTCSLVLGDTAATWAFRGRDGLLALRSRLRDTGEGEPSRLAEELERTRLVSAGGLTVRLIRVVGPGSAEVIASFLRLGLSAEPGWTMRGVSVAKEGNEIPWLGAAVA
jgi:hypothetical protein